MDLEVSGRHALLFDDDAAAAFVGSASALVPWSADASLLIDRYDVRHLLDRVPPRPSAAATAAHRRAAAEAEIDLERYRDLPPPDEDDGGAHGRGGDGDRALAHLGSFCIGLDATAQGAFQAVPFSYGNNDASSEANGTNPGMENSYYRPPFPVPENLLSNLPPTEKAHQIIARTALFVSRHGGQSEIVLRVKQGDNPTFGFLMPDNHLHAYFSYLVDHPQLLNEVRSSAENRKGKELENEEDGESVAGGGALSLLGSVYGSGDDDDSMLPADSKSMEPENNAIVSSKAGAKQDHGESSVPKVSKDKEANNLTTSTAVRSKEKNITVKSNQFASAGIISATGSRKVKDGVGQIPSSVDKLHSLQTGVSDIKPLILEPPSSIKRMMEKIVEFILRNGKEFEAVLIEQDKTVGRFPFLLPSHQYHSYYLKILEEAREAKLLGKNLSDQKRDVDSNGGSKKRVQGATSRESAVFDRSSEETSDGWLLHDSQRKEKFKMVISGGPKKDPEQPPKQREVSAEEAAAIVLAATRGVSPANAGRNVSAEGSGSGRGSLSKFASENGTGSSLQSTKDDVWIANAIAKTAALVASREADSSEASLTKEQKLKAERLKRAKMFAAMIKSGGSGGHPPLDELVGSSVAARSGSAEPSNTAGLARSEGESDPLAKEREGSSVPFDTAKHGDDEDNKSRKKHRPREEEGEDDDADDSKERHKHARKKHRSEHSTGHSRDGDDDDDDNHDHKHRKRHSSRHRHRHHRKHRNSLAEEEELSRSRRHGKSSRSKHRHRDEDNNDGGSADESRDGRSRRKHRSRSKSERDGGRGEGSESTAVEKSQAETRTAGPGGAAAADVPNDLRAKVRAMLLETM